MKVLIPKIAHFRDRPGRSSKTDFDEAMELARRLGSAAGNEPGVEAGRTRDYRRLLSRLMGLLCIQI